MMRIRVVFKEMRESLEVSKSTLNRSMRKQKIRNEKIRKFTNLENKKKEKIQSSNETSLYPRRIRSRRHPSPSRRALCEQIQTSPLGDRLQRTNH
jgi:hypothetical protein